MERKKPEQEQGAAPSPIPGPQRAAGEVVYPAPGSGGHSGPATSAGAVRGPTAAAGAVDRANLSEDIARAYAAEGHRDEAIAIYRLLLRERPDDAHLQERLDELLQQRAAGPEHERARRPKLSPSPTGPHTEPFGMLDLRELPEVYGVDEVEVLYRDPFWAFVYWEVTETGVHAARSQLQHSGGDARLVLRLFTTLPGGPGGDAKHGREVRDVALTWQHGRRYLEVPRPGAQLRVAVGLLSPEGYFAPIAHSSQLRLPPPAPGPAAPAVDWMQVAPPRSRGEQRERIAIVSRAAPHAERGLAWRTTAPGGIPAAPGGEVPSSGPAGRHGDELVYPAGPRPGGSPSGGR